MDETQQTMSMTRLFLGVLDPGGYNGPPGGYGDNSGAFTASIQVLLPYAQLLSAELVGSDFNCSFQTFAKQSCTVQQSTNLASGEWSIFTNVVGDGSLFRFTVPIRSKPVQFFRLHAP